MKEYLKIRVLRSRIYQITRSLEQFIRTAKGKYKLFKISCWRFQSVGTIKITIGTNNLHVETYRNKLEKNGLLHFYSRTCMLLNCVVGLLSLISPTIYKQYIVLNFSFQNKDTIYIPMYFLHFLPFC